MAPERFPRVPVSWGELIDKVTILEIKVERLDTAASFANAKTELDLLLAAMACLTAPPAALAQLTAELRTLNRRLWDIEDAIRRKEAGQSFDAAFVELARAVYRTNDERSRIKRQINELLKSGIVEEKHYG